MKKRLAMILAAGLMVTSLAGCGGSSDSSSSSDNGSDGGDVFTVAYCNSGDSDVFDKLKKDTFNDLVGDDATIKVVNSEANMDPQKQLNQIDDAIMQEVDAIIAVPIDYSGITPGVQNANQADIPVICLGIESEGGEYTFVGCQNRDAGVMQAEYMAEELPDNAKVLYLSGTPGLYHSVERHDGFFETMKEKRPDVEIIAEMTGEYTRDKAQKVVEDWCQSYDAFDAIVCANDQMALGAVEALKAADRLDGVLIAGVDATDEAMQKIKSGEMAISIRQSADALAKNCYETIQKLQKGEDPGERVIVDFEPVTIDNVADYLK
ncbi:sugar ABC transporter substrate-binding protein [Faecalicatena contorta]|uniref:Monosaccharide ABC transporter substrate-binding protein, CUT2 family n=1 Tax=Faecalicatena contorta TaxID=39482 RepID=A0A316A074_9FIRM|nr:sugar ABC transporter substrate-binding protein [Faecalicatena contorta]PWJ51326.1 monosaccharide ABC transporter substrate-binding protein (CUT2 family) [Faecalicatena contorta]SUQ12882.1 monosaccharide ABC transporter substrate-binding protein, CUT2 family [Faecalicatena contorta]